MAERFSDIEKPFVIHQPSWEERLKEYPDLRTVLVVLLRSIRSCYGISPSIEGDAGNRTTTDRAA